MGNKVETMIQECVQEKNDRRERRVKEKVANHIDNIAHYQGEIKDAEESIVRYNEKIEEEKKSLKEMKEAEPFTL